MKIEKVIVGDLEENCYVVSINNECLVIDPGDDVDKIINLIDDRKVLGILITHHHFDHVGALSKIEEKYDIIHSDFYNLNEGDTNIGPFKFQVIKNPGHSIDSTSYYFKEENIMFVGDFIFKNSIGRCDLEGGNYNEMEQSIERIKKFSKNIILYPGHGPSTTLNDEKEYNPFF